MTLNDQRVFSSTEALRFGWETTRANLKPLLIIGAVVAFLAMLNQALTSRGGPPAALLVVVVELLQTALMMTYISAALKLYGGEPVDLTRPGDLLANFFPYLLTAILCALIVTGGFILLLVPGVIWALKFGYAPFLVLDRKLDPIAALHESSRLTEGLMGQLLRFALWVVLVNLLGALALGIGLLWTIPTTLIAAVYVLRRLQGHAAHGAPLAPITAPPTPAIGH